MRESNTQTNNLHKLRRDKNNADPDHSPHETPQVSDPPSDDPQKRFRGDIQINNQATFAVDHNRLREAISAVLDDCGIRNGSVSIAIVDDSAIRSLNKQYLEHDYETDVLSFTLELDEQAKLIEGEIVTSYETAARECRQYQWSADDELFLYVVHGCLHLVGYDDSDDDQRKTMRLQEQKYLRKFGLINQPAAVDTTAKEDHR